MEYATYEIQNVDNGETIATDLTPADVDAWWAMRGDEYFGVRVVENVIQVAQAA